jgi:hypothetical protein
MSATAASSVIEFHSLQDSHLPAHLDVTAPQALQTKDRAGLAMVFPPGIPLFLMGKTTSFSLFAGEIAAKQLFWFYVNQ